MSTLDGRHNARGIRLAVLSNRFDSVVRAMRNTLTRTSRSGVINVARDFSCAIVSSDNSVLHWAESLPVPRCERTRSHREVDDGTAP